MKPQFSSALVAVAIALPSGYVANDLIASDATAAGKSEKQLQVETIQAIKSVRASLRLIRADLREDDLSLAYYAKLTSERLSQTRSRQP